jgi:DNA gyrase subunit A
VKGINLRTDDEVIAMDIIAANHEPDLLIVLENGFGKRTSFEHFRTQHRSGLGLKCANVTNRTGNVIGIEQIRNADADALLISKQGVVIRTPLKEIRKLGRDTQGVTVMKLQGNDTVASATILEPESIESKVEPSQNLAMNRHDKPD